MDIFSYDKLTVSMVIYTSILAFFILKYSHKNYERELDRGKWLFWLYLTIFSVQLLIVSNHMVLIFLGFVLISMGLHHLLLSFPGRERAQYAAWKKFFLSRLGDASFLAAIYYFHKNFGTFYLTEAMTAAEGMTKETMVDAYLLPSFFLALACLIKSAQFPFHFWLPETIDAPTPVSAIMHAGIINAGGFLLVKFHFLFPEGNPSLWMILALGILTVWVGGLSMLTQTDIKRKLAYSTLGQMGFMMVEFALGLYPLVILHLMGHGFYKAYGFLSAGNREFIPALPMQSSNYRLGVALLSLTLPLALGLYYQNTEVSLLTLFGIMLLGFLPKEGTISAIPFIVGLWLTAIYLPMAGEWITGVNLNQDYHNSLHSWIGVSALSILGFLVLALPSLKDTTSFQYLYCLSQRGFLSGIFSDKIIQRVKS